MTRIPIGRRRLLAPLAISLCAIAAALIAVHDHTRKDSPRVGLHPTANSAAGAGLRFAETLAVEGVRHPSVFGRTLRSIAAPGAVERLRASFGSGAAQVRAMIRGANGVLRVVPLGYRVDAFGARTASVTIWLVALVGGYRIEPMAQWRLLTMDLVWTREGWRLADGRGARGPSPLSPLPLLAAEAASFREVRHVP
jgi:hypothetical protein